jgi:hypothetical protein
MKNKFGKIKFNELEFKSILNLIFTACVAFNNQFKNQFVEIDFYNMIFPKSSTDQQGVSKIQITNELQSLLPYPCSHFYFDIKFGDRLYSKENRLSWPLLF